MPVLFGRFRADGRRPAAAFPRRGDRGACSETAGYAALRTALLAAGRDPQLKPINITVQYLAAGKSQVELRPRADHAAGAAQCQCDGGGVAG